MAPIRTLKILHITTGLRDGGAEAVLFRLITHDPNHQHEVVSLMDAGKYGPLLEAHGLPVVSLNMPPGRVTLSALWRLWKLIRARQPDVIQTWMYHADLVGGVMGWLSGSRNIVWGIHHTKLDPKFDKKTKILVAKLCALLSRAVPNMIVCCAEEARRVHAGLGYDARRICVISNGYDLSLFQPDSSLRVTSRQDLGLEETEPVIGFVARYHPQKDHSNLLQALAILKEGGQCPKCLLIGTGMDERNSELNAQIDALEVRNCVRLLGPRHDVPAIMNALDLHVMSSAFGEAFPNVLAEAMACGTPCVATDVGDAPVIVGDTGRIVPTRNPKALAGAITALLTELGSQGWSARCEAARRRIDERFSVQRMVTSYSSVWVGQKPLIERSQGAS